MDKLHQLRLALLVRPLRYKEAQVTKVHPTHQILFLARGPHASRNFGLKSHLPKACTGHLITTHKIETRLRMVPYVKAPDMFYKRQRFQLLNVAAEPVENTHADTGAVSRELGVDPRGVAPREFAKLRTRVRHTDRTGGTTEELRARVLRHVVASNPKLVANRTYRGVEQLGASTAEVLRAMRAAGETVPLGHRRSLRELYTDPTRTGFKVAHTAGLGYTPRSRLRMTPNGPALGSVVPGRYIGATVRGTRSTAVGGFVVDTRAERIQPLATGATKPIERMQPVQVQQAQVLPNGAVQVHGQVVNPHEAERAPVAWLQLTKNPNPKVADILRVLNLTMNL